MCTVFTAGCVVLEQVVALLSRWMLQHLAFAFRVCDSHLFKVVQKERLDQEHPASRDLLVAILADEVVDDREDQDGNHEHLKVVSPWRTSRRDWRRRLEGVLFSEGECEEREEDCGHFIGK